MDLSDDNVDSVIHYCLFDDDDEAVSNLKPGEIPHGAVIVESLTGVKFGFDPKKLKDKENDIKSMLAQLPDEFMDGIGEGWSFLNACMNKNMVQWTGSHKTMDLLFVLGQAIGCAKTTINRSMWGSLPGGVPYYVININGF